MATKQQPAQRPGPTPPRPATAQSSPPNELAALSRLIGVDEQRLRQFLTIALGHAHTGGIPTRTIGELVYALLWHRATQLGNSHLLIRDPQPARPVAVATPSTFARSVPVAEQPRTVEQEMAQAAFIRKLHAQAEALGGDPQPADTQVDGLAPIGITPQRDLAQLHFEANMLAEGRARPTQMATVPAI